MLTSNEMAILVARTDDVPQSIARDVVERQKINVAGFYGRTYDASLDAWLTAYERGYNDAIKAMGAQQ